MNEVDVKQAIARLYDGGKMTQAEIAVELNCSQPNVFYHLNNKAANPRVPARFVEHIKAAFARRGWEVPMCAAPAGAI